MNYAHLNSFDGIVLGIMALSCLFAFFRGLVREILSLAAWVGAAVVTMRYFPAVAAKLEPQFRVKAVADTMAAVGLYIGALMLLSFFSIMILKTIKHGSNTGMLDSLLGFVFGGFRGAFILSLAYFMLTMAMPENEYPQWLTQSVTRPYIEQGAIMLNKAAPSYLSDLSSLEKKMANKAQEAQQQQQDQDEPHAPIEDKEYGNQGYSNSSSQQLNRLIESTGANR